MNSAKLLRLPTAAAYPPPRKSWPGALPKTVVRYCDMRDKRRQQIRHREAFEAHMESLQSTIATMELYLADTRLQLASLRQMEIGSDQALRVTKYLDWMDMSQEWKERFLASGYEPPEPPV